MDPERGQYKAYLVRLWQAASTESSPWRASVEEARTGVRYSFANLDMLFTFFEAEAQGHSRSSSVQMQQHEHDHQEPKKL